MNPIDCVRQVLLADRRPLSTRNSRFPADLYSSADKSTGLSFDRERVDRR